MKAIYPGDLCKVGSGAAAVRFQSYPSGNESYPLYELNYTQDQKRTYTKIPGLRAKERELAMVLSVPLFGNDWEKQDFEVMILVLVQDGVGWLRRDLLHVVK